MTTAAVLKYQHATKRSPGEAERGKLRKQPLYMVSSEWARIQRTGITMSEGASRARLISDLYMVPQIPKMPTHKDAAVPKKEPFGFGA